MKKCWICLGLAVLLMALCSCKQNPTEQELFSKLIAHFEDRGYTCALSRLDETDPERDVPIYRASVWHRLMVDDEEVLVYFDESNRADYLSAPIDESEYGHVSRFGLRFVVIYEGEDAGVIRALEEMKDVGQ